MCTLLLPLGVNPIAVVKYIINLRYEYHHYTIQEPVLELMKILAVKDLRVFHGEYKYCSFLDAV